MADDVVEVKSKFEQEYRRFSMKRTELKTFELFMLHIKSLHKVGDVDSVSISYTEPLRGDLLPINNDDNFAHAVSLSKPLLRIFVYRGQDALLADMFQQARKRKVAGLRPDKKLGQIQIGTPEDFRKVSAIVDADLLPETVRRVKLLKHSSNKPLGFYIRDGMSTRVTPQNVLEKVPGIFISRLVPGGLAEGTGLLAVDDEILEVNGIEVTGKTLDQVTDMMVANSQNLIITVKPGKQAVREAPSTAAAASTGAQAQAGPTLSSSSSASGATGGAAAASGARPLSGKSPTNARGGSASQRSTGSMERRSMRSPGEDTQSHGSSNSGSLKRKTEAANPR
eukprot:scpid75477/ scgid30575/ Partitioning defective 6 homolog beta